MPGSISSSATLAAIKCRFAGREEAVGRAYENSESFRSLCRDYLACTAALARWQEGGSEEALLRTGEYSELLSELTAEIETCLADEGWSCPTVGDEPLRRKREERDGRERP